MIDFDEFSFLLRSPELPLGEALLRLAACEYEIDVEAYLGYLNELTLRVLEGLSGESPNIIVTLNQVLFDEEGFAVSLQNEPEPRYHHLNVVLDERLGSALSLGVIYLEVGWRLGLPLEGVLFPERFLIKMPVHEKNVLIVDPASAGRALNAQDLLKHLRHSEKTLHIGQVLAALSSASNRDVLIHFVDNLRHLYAERRQWQPYVQLCDVLLLLKPNMHSLLRDKAEACEYMECFSWALRDYRRYLAEEKDTDELIVQRVEKLESRVKLMN